MADLRVRGYVRWHTVALANHQLTHGVHRRAADPLGSHYVSVALAEPGLLRESAIGQALAFAGMQINHRTP